MDYSSTSVISKLQKEWDDLSQENAFHYIASLKRNWAQQDFLLSGESDVATLVDPFLSAANFEPCGKTVLEIGCGVGRMSFALAKRFAMVEGTDISSEMIQRANSLQKELSVKNVRFRKGSGQDLAEYGDGTMDVCFSYIVMQHIPDVSIILRYLREIGRVLKRGGLFRVQVNGYWHVKLPSDRYLMWGTCGTHRLRKLNITTRPHIRFGKLDGWHGVPIAVADIKTTCTAVGLACTDITGVGTQFMWVNGRKESLS